MKQLDLLTEHIKTLKMEYFLEHGIAPEPGTKVWEEITGEEYTIESKFFSAFSKFAFLEEVNLIETANRIKYGFVQLQLQFDFVKKQTAKEKVVAYQKFYRTRAKAKFGKGKKRTGNSMHMSSSGR